MSTQRLSRREQRRLVRDIRAAHRRQSQAQQREREQLCGEVGHDWEAIDDELETCGHCDETRERFNQAPYPSTEGAMMDAHEAYQEILAATSAGTCVFTEEEILASIRSVLDRYTATDDDPTDIHTWFGLTYANYLVLPRSVLQSMPDRWQHSFTALLDELFTAVHHADVEIPDRYRVQPVDANGRFMSDPTPHYNRGRTYIHGLDPDRDARTTERGV